MITILRRAGETLSIGNNVTLVVLASKGNEVRIGIMAPQSVRVERISKEQARIGLAERRADADAENDGEVEGEDDADDSEATEDVAPLRRVA